MRILGHHYYIKMTFKIVQWLDYTIFFVYFDYTINHMSAPKNIVIKERIEELKRELKTASSMITPRIKCLLK